MREISSILLIFLFISCGSRKRVIDNTPKETSEAAIVKDTITEDIIKVKIAEIKITSVSNDTEDKDIEHLTKQETATLISPEDFNHSPWNDLLQKHVSKKGNVDYKGFKNSRKELLNYISELGKFTPKDDWNREDKLAYWINAYNAMTIDLILRHYPIKSIKDINNPWEQRFWKLGEKWYNLNDIEHRILRKMNEPRIHFAIVCASISCPKLQNEAYNALSLEEQLTNITKDFLNDPTRNSLSEDNLKLSKIFQWFTKDFKQNGSLIDFLNQYSEVSISNKTKKSYLDYNWNLNE